jgi:hypothetical protein
MILEERFAISPRKATGSDHASNMPRTGIPFRAYFFGRTFVTWFDATAEGTRKWSVPKRMDEVWPQLSGIFDAPTPGSPLGVYPVASTVLNLNNGSKYLDVAKGSLVPNPRAVKLPSIILPPGQPVTFGLPPHVVSWDVGPIALVRNMMGSPAGSTNIVDMRDFSVGPAEMTFLPPDDPMIAIPGGEIYWFTADDPQRIGYLGFSHTVDGIPVGWGPVTKPVAEVFPQLPNDRIVDATVVYGAHATALADVTAALSDADVRAIGALAGPLGAQPDELLAALYLLSGLRPTAYHPQGFFGLPQLAAPQLPFGGWSDSAETFLEADAQRQISVLATYLGRFPFHAGAHWVLADLLSGEPLVDLGDATVVARAPYTARMGGWATVSPEGFVSDTVTIADLRRAIADVLSSPLEYELRHRIAETTLA